MRRTTGGTPSCREGTGDETAEAEGATAAGYYILKSMSAIDSPDPRCKVEGAIAELAAQLREHATLPADPEDPTRPWHAALREDAAVQLPQKHCAFKKCTWEGTTDAELLRHVSDEHRASLKSVTALLAKSASEEERVFAAYNEAIAVGVRRGAPLAAYSIDRRCLFSYTQSISDENVESLICFLCARRFPHVASFTSNDIRWVAPLSDSGADAEEGTDSQSERERFCGFGREQTEDSRCGLDAKLPEHMDYGTAPTAQSSIFLRCAIAAAWERRRATSRNHSDGLLPSVDVAQAGRR